MTQTHSYYEIRPGSMTDTNSAVERLDSAAYRVSMSMPGKIYHGPSVAEELREASAFTALSQDSFSEDWDNPEDALYNTL